MTTAKEDDTLIAITRAYQEYHRTTGRKPTRLYVGHDEWFNLTCSARWVYRHYNVENPTQPPEVMGMSAFEVCAPSHIYVC